MHSIGLAGALWLMLSTVKSDSIPQLQQRSSGALYEPTCSGGFNLSADEQTCAITFTFMTPNPATCDESRDDDGQLVLECSYLAVR